jgi:4-carboxymuconolactone decarboxylase
MTSVDRLPLLDWDDWDNKAREVLPSYLRRPELYRRDRPDALPMPRIFSLFAHNVPISASWMAFNNLLAGEDSTLEPAQRELVILRLAWQTRSRYEWNQHIRIGSQVGISTAQLYAVAEGPDAEVWTPLEAALLRATDEVLDHYSIDDATWELLAETFEPAQLLELTFVIGSYLALAPIVASTGVPADPPSEPVDAPELPERGT